MLEPQYPLSERKNEEKRSIQSLLSRALALAREEKRKRKRKRGVDKNSSKEKKKRLLNLSRYISLPKKRRERRPATICAKIKKEGGRRFSSLLRQKPTASNC